MPIRKPLAAIVLAVLLGLSAAHTAWAAAQDGSVESIWDAEQQPAALPAGEQDVDRSGDFVLYVDDRWYCHRVIAKLPPEAREIYRCLLYTSDAADE